MQQLTYLCVCNLTPQVECYRLKSNTSTLSLSFSQSVCAEGMSEECSLCGGL